MKNSFDITLNQQIIYTYSKKSLPARLRRFLDEVDDSMSEEIQIDEEKVVRPTEFQKLQYVAMNLFAAVESNNKNQQEVMSAYLLNKKSDLEEIRVIENNDIINLKLI